MLTCSFLLCSHASLLSCFGAFVSIAGQRASSDVTEKTEKRLLSCHEEFTEETQQRQSPLPVPLVDLAWCDLDIGL